MHRRGKYVFPNNTVYDGEFFDGEMHGEGTLSFPTKGYFVGKWYESFATLITGPAAAIILSRKTHRFRNSGSME
jgi:hypothetical protein